MGLHDGHRNRMRQRLKNSGLDSFQDHEVLEWILFHTRPRGDVNDLAHHLIDEFGGLAAVLNADYEALMRVNGVGETTALFLSQLRLVYRRYEQKDQQLKKRFFKSVSQMAEYMRQNHFDHKREDLYVLLMGDNMNLICTHLLATGSLRAVHMDYRRLMSLCLNTKATHVALAHNHPSSILIPSSSDISTTINVAEVLKKIDVILVDHLIIGEDDYVSMAESEETAYIFPPLTLPDQLY